MVCTDDIKRPDRGEPEKDATPGADVRENDSEKKVFEQQELQEGFLAD